MRLLIISNYFFPEIGAAPYRVYCMAKGLSNNHKVEVIAPMPNYPHGKIADGYKGRFLKTDFVDQMKVFRYFIYPSKSKSAILRILSMLSFAVCLWFSWFQIKKTKGIDAVIIQNSPLLISFSSIILYKKILGRKIILNVSDLWPGSALDLGYVKEGKFYNLLKKIEQFNYRNSNAIVGQSQVILDEIKKDAQTTPQFLYRNIQPTSPKVRLEKTKKFSIVYAGIIGVAQGILEIVNHVDFDALNIQFDIYGDGAEKDDILALIAQKNIKNISYKGMIPKRELNKILPQYHFALVPLTTPIKGAVPSKIFDFVSNTIPVVYMGSGEAEQIIKTYNLGFTVASKAFKALNTVLNQISTMQASEYQLIQKSCEQTSRNVLNFENQLKNFNTFLEAITAK
ncbi:MAG: glycosyltransferase family 4 protein [Winogradskyella sp.]